VVTWNWWNWIWKVSWSHPDERDDYGDSRGWNRPGANIGDRAAVFEAVHGSAPDIAGQHIANPGALVLGAAQMLTHMGMDDRARKLRLAMRETIVAGDRVTPDLGGHGNTVSMTDAIVERLQA